MTISLIFSSRGFTVLTFMFRYYDPFRVNVVCVERFNVYSFFFLPYGYAEGLNLNISFVISIHFLFQLTYLVYWLHLVSNYY